ncbi:MAG: DUF4394 domain-containing protein [Chitinophagaceae bacterium]|nr:MAG: DUF4394 domain-containing protein [Chitinophagaceae bacterium]
MYLKTIASCRGALAIAAISLFTLSSCDKNDDDRNNRPDKFFIGLTDDGKLNLYNANRAETAESSVTISGLQSGEKILSIDFRPATGQLFGLGSSSRLYTINYGTGAATIVGAGPFTPAIAGDIANIDFNPTVDRIRLVSNSGQNLRLHPETGVVAFTDGAINGGSSPVITSIAYTDSKAGAATTTLFDIDMSTKKLYRQDPPNNGTLVEIGNLNVNFTGKGGFDISPENDIALASFTVDSKSELYTINLTTGAASKVSGISATLVDLAIPSDPVAFTVDESNNLQVFNPANSAAPVAKAIMGLAGGENIVGIDFRPANGQLYALGSSSRIYTINTATGAATAVGSAGQFTLSGTSFGFDFNPTVDRIRIVSNTGQNIRVNPNDGTMSGNDAALNPGTPSVTGSAYTNNKAGVTTTVLFGIDNSTGKLYRQDPPNNGTLVEIGSLGVTIEAGNGFDIGGNSDNAYAILSTGGTTRFYSVNLNTGAAAPGRDFPNKVRGFALGLGF